MKKSGIYSVLLCTMVMAVLTGCGDGSEESTESMFSSSSKANVVTAEPALSDEERQLVNYELKYSTGEFTPEDYQALAGIYGEMGLIRKQRDMLEQSYRLYQDVSAFEALQSIAVNLEEEDADIAGEAQTMLQNLEISEYLGEAVHMIGGERWMEVMMPKLYQGKRNYFLTKEGRTVLSIQAGYAENGSAFSHVWYYGSDGQVIYLKKSGNAVQILKTSLEEGLYDGPFELWTLEGASGSIFHEQGTFAKGVFAGDYTVSVHAGTETGDVFDLWNNKDGMSYVIYKGNFDGEGKTTLEQPAEDKLKSLLGDMDSKNAVVYAYGENGRDSLFLPLPEETQATAYSFGIGFMGVEAYPDFTVYEVKENTQGVGAGDDTDAETAGNKNNDSMVAVSDIKVRIFDGEVQFFDGKKWVSAGTVTSLSLEDPFRIYAQEKEDFVVGGSSESGEEGQSTGRLQTGTISEDKPVNNKPANTKPTNNKPANTTQNNTTNNTTNSTTPATPTPPVQEQPSNPTPPSNPEPPSDPTPPSNSEPPADSGGGDVDIEWSPDLLD